MNFFCRCIQNNQTENALETHIKWLNSLHSQRLLIKQKSLFLSHWLLLFRMFQYQMLHCRRYHFNDTIFFGWWEEKIIIYFMMMSLSLKNEMIFIIFRVKQKLINQKASQSAFFVYIIKMWSVSYIFIRRFEEQNRLLNHKKIF